jgi:PKHD-type hydroxylase
MKGEWCYFKSYFDKNTCNEILEKAKLIETQDAVLGLNNDPQVNFEYRRSKVRFLNSDDWRFKDLFTDLWKTAIMANRDFFNFHITKLDFVQLAEYDASYQGEYKEHHDVFWLNNDPDYHRKMTAVIQLSDPNDYEGGDLVVTETVTPPGPTEFRDQGTIIFFPSFLRHKATPVIRGTRYSIAAWFEGPKWR